MEVNTEQEEPQYQTRRESYASSETRIEEPNTVTQNGGECYENGDINMHSSAAQQEATGSSQADGGVLNGDRISLEGDNYESRSVESDHYEPVHDSSLGEDGATRDEEPTGGSRSDVNGRRMSPITEEVTTRRAEEERTGAANRNGGHQPDANSILDGNYRYYLFASG